MLALVHFVLMILNELTAAQAAKQFILTLESESQNLLPPPNPLSQWKYNFKIEKTSSSS